MVRRGDKHKKGFNVGRLRNQELRNLAYADNWVEKRRKQWPIWY